MGDSVLASPTPPTGQVVPIAGHRSPVRTPADLARLGMWIGMAPIAMLFLALISAFVVRRGLGGDWVPVRLPTLVWVNTGVLLLSSITAEIGRRALRANRSNVLWAWGTVALGIAFLVGQVLAWRQLLGAGVTVGATPYGSFFYVLTGTHAVHLLGGVLGLLTAALWPQAGFKNISRAAATHIAAMYWHFMDILWVGIFLLLIFGR